MPTPHRLALKRVYAAASPADGRRVLVERLWPRGLRKEEARVDLWLKEVAPSHALRRWFHEAPRDASRGGQGRKPRNAVADHSGTHDGTHSAHAQVEHPG